MVVHSCNPSYTRGRGRRIMVRGQPQAKMQDPTRKITKAKRTGGTTQVVEPWLSRLEVLSPIPSTPLKPKTTLPLKKNS
jgi:hypothetical protein